MWKVNEMEFYYMRSVEYKNVPIEKIRKNTWNSNQVSPSNEQKIRNSIKRNGIFKPIIVRTIPGESGYEIVGGEHRWEQAFELGYQEVPIVNLGDISLSQAKEIGVIDNARYGVDDTLSLAEILKDIDADNLQDFLPYGETDLDAIFSASDIELDDLEIDENFESPQENNEIREESDIRPQKTHTIMRFKISLSDAERLTEVISRTQREEGLTTSDELTNAGDALIHIIGAKVFSNNEG